MKEQPKKTTNRGIGKLKPTTKESEGKNYLFSIAIDEYHNLPKLNNCVKDAKDIVELLTSKYHFEGQDVFLFETTKRNTATHRFLNFKKAYWTI